MQPKANKAIKNRPQKAWAGLANARLLLRRWYDSHCQVKHTDPCLTF